MIAKTSNLLYIGSILIVLFFAVHFSKYYTQYSVTYWYNYLRFSPYMRECYIYDSFQNNAVESIAKIQSEKAAEYKNTNIVNFLSQFIPLEFPQQCKTRVGRIYDGGYVLMEEYLGDIEVLYSYGVEYDTYFEKDFKMRNPNTLIRLYDFSVGYVPYESRFYFYKEGLGPKDDPVNKLGTLETHLKKNGDLGKRKMLKVDIEGAEWDSFDQIDESLLKEFDHLVMELHDLGKDVELQNRVMSKINSLFYIYHVHANNWQPITNFEEGLKIPSTVEISCIRKDLVESARVSKQKFPGRLDAPNKGDVKDIPLNFWPFEN